MPTTRLTFPAFAINIDGVEAMATGELTVTTGNPAPTIEEVLVEPFDAAPGVERTVTIKATNAETFRCYKPDGTPVTAVAGQPNVFKFTP